MHRQICLLAQDGISPALTKKNDYGVMIGKESRKKEEKEETQPRAELEASMQRKGGVKRKRATRGTKMQRFGEIVLCYE